MYNFIWHLSRFKDSVNSFLLGLVASVIQWIVWTSVQNSLVDLQDKMEGFEMEGFSISLYMTRVVDDFISDSGLGIAGLLAGKFKHCLYLQTICEVCFVRYVFYFHFVMV